MIKCISAEIDTDYSVSSTPLKLHTDITNNTPFIIEGMAKPIKQIRSDFHLYSLVKSQS